MISKTSYKALKVLESKNANPLDGTHATQIATAVWGDDPKREYLFTAVSNQGNGACASKKAWLCAGSLMGKLIKKGLAYKTFDGTYRITDEGIKALKQYESETSK